MVDRPKPLNIEVGRQKTGDPVYAVNKAGDFSKKSVREPDWPQNAAEKQTLSEINDSKSEGAARFMDAMRRVMFLGDMPRGLPFVSTTASNSETDSSMGLVTLPRSDLQETYRKRMEAVDSALEQSQNPPEPFKWIKSKTVMKDKNDPGSSKAPEGTEKAISAYAIPSPATPNPTGNDIINVEPLKNKELKVL